MSDNTKTLAKFDADLNIIQKLGDEPNTDNNLNAAELKEKFDEAANIIQRYINEVLVPYAAGKANGTHAEQHAKDGADPVTPLSIGALPLSGNSAEAPMTGDIYRKASEGTSGGRIHQRDGQAVLYSYTDLETDDNYRALEVNAPDGAYSDLSKAISFVERKNGVETRYNLLHEGVISGAALLATGSYKGSGSATKTITVGFRPKFFFIGSEFTRSSDKKQVTVGEYSYVKLDDGTTGWYYVGEHSNYDEEFEGSVTDTGIKITVGGNSLAFGNSGANNSSRTYNWVAFG